MSSPSLTCTSYWSGIYIIVQLIPNNCSECFQKLSACLNYLLFAAANHTSWSFGHKSTLVVVIGVLLISQPSLICNPESSIRWLRLELQYIMPLFKFAQVAIWTRCLGKKFWVWVDMSERNMVGWGVIHAEQIYLGDRTINGKIPSEIRLV